MPSSLNAIVTSLPKSTRYTSWADVAPVRRAVTCTGWFTAGRTVFVTAVKIGTSPVPARC